MHPSQSQRAEAELVTRREAAALLGKSTSWIRKLAGAGRLHPILSDAGCWLYPRSEVAALVQAQVRPSVQAPPEVKTIMPAGYLHAWEGTQAQAPVQAQPTVPAQAMLPPTAPRSPAPPASRDQPPAPRTAAARPLLVEIAAAERDARRTLLDVQRERTASVQLLNQIARERAALATERREQERAAWRGCRIDDTLGRLGAELAAAGWGDDEVAAGVRVAAQALAGVGDGELSGPAWPGWIAARAASLAVAGVDVEQPWLVAPVADGTGGLYPVPVRPVAPGD